MINQGHVATPTAEEQAGILAEPLGLCVGVCRGGERNKKGNITIIICQLVTLAKQMCRYYLTPFLYQSIFLLVGLKLISEVENCSDFISPERNLFAKYDFVLPSYEVTLYGTGSILSTIDDRTSTGLFRKARQYSTNLSFVPSVTSQGIFSSRQ